MGGGFEKLMSISRADFESAAYKMLGEIVPGYGTAAAEGLIDPLVALMLQPEAHRAHRDKRMYMQKTSPDQIRPAHMLDANPVDIRFFDALVADGWK